MAGCIADPSPVLATNAAITAQRRGRQWTLVMETLEGMASASQEAGD